MEQLLGIVGFEDRGNFVLGEQYEYLNIVSTADGCYFAKKGNRDVPLTDEDTWKQFSRLGVDGKNIELGINSTHLQWRLEGEPNWTDLIALSSLKGADGKELEIRTQNGYIQTRLTGENWSDLVDLENLKGPKGDRGNQGKPLIVLSNGHYGYWDEVLADYVDSGIEASATTDIENAVVNFTEAATRENLQTGENVPTLFGKIKKWFNDLGALAWKNKVDYTIDIENLPNLVTSMFVNDAVNNHNVDSTAHNDIRDALTNLANTTLFEHVTQLPESGKANKIYVISNPASEDEENKYLEYYWNASESKWEMLGGAGGGSQSGGVVNPNYEIVTVSPQSNHVNIEHEFIDNVQIEVSWDETVQRQWTFDGSPMTLLVPKDKEYTIKVSDLDWFNTPEPLVYTAEGGNTRTASPTYTCSEIHVALRDNSSNLTADLSYLLDGAVVKVSLNGKEKELYYQGYNNPSTLYAPIGSELEFMGTETMSDVFVPVLRTLHVTGDKMSFSYQYKNGGLSINGYGSNNDSFTYTFSILDADTNEILFADIESVSQRNKFIPMRVGRKVIVKFGLVDGYRKPDDIQVTVSLGNEYIGANYQTNYLQISKNITKEVTAKVYNDETNVQYEEVIIPTAYVNGQSVNVRVSEGFHYRVEFSEIEGYDTPTPMTGVVAGSYTSVQGQYGGSLFTLHNNNNNNIHVTLRNADTDDIYLDKDIQSGRQENITIPIGVSYHLLATLNEETILEEEGTSKSESKHFTIQRRTYFVRMYHQQEYTATYVFTNLDTNEVVEKELGRYQSADIELPVKTNYKVELKSYQGLGLPEPYIGNAVFPEGNNNTQYYQSISLAYDAVQMNIQSSMSYVQLPERIFTIFNRDTNEIFDTVVVPSGNTSIYTIMPKDFNYEIRANEIPNFSTPSPYQGNSGTSSNSYVNMQYGYYVIYGQNTNGFDVNARIINTDTEAQLYSFVISSHNNSQYFPIRPGVNYRIEFGDVTGYRTPSPITGTATVNNTYYLNSRDMMYTAV